MSEAAPLLPTTAPFAREEIEKLNAVMAASSAEQRSWLSGFLAGYAAATSPAALQAPAAAPTPARKRPLTILYATESGNAEEVAADAKKAASRLGFTAKLVDMADTTPADMAKVENLLVVASTWAAYRRLYVAESVAAVVTGPLVVIRAPQPSFSATSRRRRRTESES